MRSSGFDRLFQFENLGAGRYNLRFETIKYRLCQ